MLYKAENIDTDKFLEQIQFLEKFDIGEEQKERIATEKYHEGYRKALATIESMFYCSNYEKRSEDSNVK